VQTVSVTAMGLSGLLLDLAAGAFSDEAQRRLLSLSDTLRGRNGVSEVVPGMNNLLIEIDPEVIGIDEADALLRRLWQDAAPAGEPGKTVEIPVVYGGAAAEDIEDWAAHAGLTVRAAIDRHAAGRYSVAAVGAMPGFGYLSGLDPKLAMPRRKVPRGRVAEGAVIIGGAQAGVMPTTAPSGWHIIGHTSVKLFDPMAEAPCLFLPGDRVRFVVDDILT